MGKSIAVIGTLDTKGDQVEYLVDIIEHKGHKAIVVDTGVLGEPACESTITRHQIAQAAGTTLDEIIAIGHKGQETKSMGKMAEGTRKVLKKLNDEESIDGVLAVGGSMGTSLALNIMDVLPLTMPKIILSTIANSPVINSDYYTHNIIMLPWIGGLWGINEVSRLILDQVAAIIVTASELYERKPLSSKSSSELRPLAWQPLFIYITSGQNWKPGTMKFRVFHATGMSPRLLEKAITDGSIDISLELFIGHELSAYMLGSGFSPGPNRLEAAIKAGIPMVVSPGNMELICVEANAPLPEGFPERVQLEHNSLLWMITTSKKEKIEATRILIEKLNRTTGPTAFVFPLRTPDGIAKYGLDDPDGMDAVRQELKKNLKSEIRYMEVDSSQDDPPYADAVIKMLDEMTV